MIDDKKTERNRYDARARALLEEGPFAAGDVPVPGSLAIPPVFRSPYVYYEELVRQHVHQNHDVLELGSGTGLHTHALMQAGARVVATDISSRSLEVLSRRIGRGVKTGVADMEYLPFEAGSFDVVAIAGGLSYGSPDLVDAEIGRVLRPGGAFFCVDSLNHHPIYRFNRWVHHLKGERTKSTLLRMPTMQRIQSISRGFNSTDVRYFGSVSFMMPLLAHVIGQSMAARVSDSFDRLVHVRRSAFKFVLAAYGRL
jgi:ubiquinone/menaquinone biosynthesis C-methylase UbiE